MWWRCDPVVGVLGAGDPVRFACAADEPLSLLGQIAALARVVPPARTIAVAITM
ncbi:MAG TPA: hypothetical protein VF206_07195 [Rubrobacter sp.]